MGSFLSAPVELIRVQRKGNSAYTMAAAEMHGWRGNHEDCHAMSAAEDGGGVFFVLDGHGGDGASLFGAPALAEEFKRCNAAGNLPDDAKIRQGFSEVDSRIRSHFAERPDKDSGTTVVGMVSAKHPDGSYSLKMLNCGDSRGIVLRPAAMKEEEAPEIEMRVPEHLQKLAADGYVEEMQNKPLMKQVAVQDVEMMPSAMAGKPGRGTGFPVVAETIDHKPSHPTEKSRIEAAGGSVSADDVPRLDGNLAVSRGLGDFEYKRGEGLPEEDQKVSCIPDIYEISGLPTGTVVVLACDGVWDVMTGQDVGALVLGALREDPKADIGAISAEIVRSSLRLNSRDNVTAMVIVLGDGEEWGEAQKDEMLDFDKLLEGGLEEDVKKQYDSFLRKCNFPLKPIACDVCGRWLEDMSQCPCKTIHYCGKSCQKKGWKTHKTICSAAPGNAAEGTSSPKKGSPKNT